MAGPIIPTGFLIAAMLAASAHAADAAAPIRYDLSFHMQGEALETVVIRVAARTGPDGMVDFTIPAQPADDVHAEHGLLDTATPGHLILRGPPGTDVAMSWRSPPASLTRTFTRNLVRAVLVRPDAIAASTNILFPIPPGSGDLPVTVHWKAPAGWTVSTSLVDGTQSAAQLAGGTFMAARHARTSTARAGAARITVTTVDGIRDVKRTAGDVARAVAEVTPPAARHDYTLNIVDFDGDGPGLSMSTQPFGGTAYLTSGVPEKAWLQWLMVAAALPGRQGSDPATAWYTEGFTSFRTVRRLFAQGYLSPVTFAFLTDQATTSYGNSPYRRAPQSQVLEEYATSSDMHDLPVNRGALFALLLDARIRTATGGKKSLEDALARMDVRSGDPGASLIEAVAAIGGGDITPAYRRYIVEGDLLQLPRDALGPCFTIGTVADWSGWQVQHVFAKPSCHASL